MTIRECYEQTGSDFRDVMNRLMTEKLVEKFARKFLADPSYGALCEAMQSGDVEAAFRAAHTLKGVCQNLSFTRLAKASSDITEALRAGNGKEAADLLPTVTREYLALTTALGSLPE